MLRWSASEPLTPYLGVPGHVLVAKLDRSQRGTGLVAHSHALEPSAVVRSEACVAAHVDVAPPLPEDAALSGVLVGSADMSEPGVYLVAAWLGAPGNRVLVSTPCGIPTDSRYLQRECSVTNV